MDHVLLKEMFATKIVTVELHDNEEFLAKEEEEKLAKFSVGRAKFSLRDFLRPNCHELKLRSDIFPLKKDDVDNTQNLDLNQTARKNEKTIDKACPYLTNATYATIIANLARPVGEFNKEKEIALYRLSLKHNQEENKEAKTSQDNIRNYDIQPTLTALSSQHQSTFFEDGTWNENDAIFERIIIMIPYKSPDIVKKIEDTFEKVNLKGLNLPNARYLSTKEFSEQEKKDRKLDFIGGFCLMDSELRIYIFEGLGGQGRSMH